MGAFSLLGVVCFGSLGIAFAHAIPNVDSAPAWVNAVFLPLIFISGVFYSADELPGVLKAIAEALPLKHLIDGLSAGIVGGGEDTLAGGRRGRRSGRWWGCCSPCASSAGVARGAARARARAASASCSRQPGQRAASSRQKRSEWSCTSRCATSCSTT